MSSYLIRIDDMAPNMNWDVYFRAKDLFAKYGVKPIIGVIPDNKDPKLLVYPQCSFNFWEEVRSIQKDGWEIAVHGYQHLYDSQGKNYLGIKAPSEFANHSEPIQREKLTKAMEIFRRENVATEVFFAPSHTFDLTTVQVLKSLGIKSILDGYNFYPYIRHGMLFIPQVAGRPMRFPFGLHTSVHHFNEYRERDFQILEDFLKHNSDCVVTYQTAKSMVGSGITSVVAEFLLRYSLQLKRRLLST